MMSPCDQVAERIALDEPLAELTQHADDCPRCQGLLAAQRMISSHRRDDTPAHGFAARMTVAANQRLVVRHRRRVAGYAGLSAAAAALVTFFLVREPAKQAPPPVAATQLKSDSPAEDDDSTPPEDPWQSDDEREAVEPSEVPDEATDEATDDAVDALEEGRDEDAQALYRMYKLHAIPVHAKWKKIEAPLRPYQRLLEEAGD